VSVKSKKTHKRRKEGEGVYEAYAKENVYSKTYNLARLVDRSKKVSTPEIITITSVPAPLIREQRTGRPASNYSRSTARPISVSRPKRGDP